MAKQSKKRAGGKRRAYDLGGSGAPYDLFENFVTDGTVSIQEHMLEGGMVNAAKTISQQVETIAVTALNALAEAGLEAAQEAVPIDSEELRDEHIQTTKASTSRERTKVFVDGGDHYQYGRRKTPEHASSLAEWLQVTPAKRTRRHGLTQFWVNEAHDLFRRLYRDQALKKVL